MKALVDLTIVRRISEDTNIANIDWCDYIYRCLKYSEKPKTSSGFYNGALCFLILLYFDSTKFEGLPIIRYRPAIKNWNSSLMNQRQKLEIEREEIGTMELHGKWSESEVQGTEGFFDGSVKVRQAHSSRVPPTDKQSFCRMINDKLSSISREKVELEDLLKNANTEFPNDEDVLELYKKYGAVFKETVVLEDVHVDYFDPEDRQDDGSNDSGKKDDDGAKKDVGVDKVSFCSMINDKLSSISREKVELEDLLKNANTEFPNDEDVLELYKKYGAVFKETVVLEDVHVDDFDPEDRQDDGSNDSGKKDDDGAKKDVENVDDASEGVGAKKDGDNVEENIIVPVLSEEPVLSEDSFTQWIEENIDWIGEVIDCICDAYYDDEFLNWPRVVKPVNTDCPRTPERVVTRSSPKKRIAKPSSYLSSPYENKQTKVIALLKRIEFELGNSLFAMQGDKMEIVFQTRAGDHEVSAVRLNMETLAPSLWIDNNVVDAWGAILNYEESAKKNPSPKKKAKKDAVTKRHFFPTGCITEAMVQGTIGKGEQWDIFSAEISAHLKKVDASKCVLQPKWKTNDNHVDCGVFAMIHMESYVGEPVKDWDAGLCQESDMQVSLLRRMRFKIATKILLHELNLHSQNMYDLAFQFQEIEEQKRISIIVNATGPIVIQKKSFVKMCLNMINRCR
ncbi:hypothetical protein CTI12_AA283080 [Artemisia annua]|uniref:Ulp1 protease family, C-terminal catalytic domain-containing protein n=1 Tax=Artemisia annua TaxID=35608 RepID=A0A2U1NCL1_ARTAN|nr:hypothetical protein CTI12_AA283080 [Artemisia annua]